jgi:hypothetical protein
MAFVTGFGDLASWDTGVGSIALVHLPRELLQQGAHLLELQRRPP